MARNCHDEVAAVLDSEAADRVLRFWFEEITTEDWFRQSHALDDRIRCEFGALHQRAAAGELAGWMSRPDTCLALVVILDQFSRNIYGRGTSEGCAWDAMARVAANAALARGDDKNRWEPGPRRSALYLPFMHSEDLADKRRCVQLMREGLSGQPSSPSAGDSSGNAATNAGAGGASPKSARSALPRLNAAQVPNSTKQRQAPGAGQVQSARRLSVSAAHGPSSNAVNRPPSRDEDGQGFESDVSADSDCDSSAWNLSAPITAKSITGGAATSAAQQPGILNSDSWKGNDVSGCSRTDACTSARIEVIDHAGVYNMRAALELPQLPVLSLNHEQARRFRAMKCAQTQQTYLRDRKDVNRTVRYQCLVCAVTHEFKLGKTAAVGAE